MTTAEPLASSSDLVPAVPSRVNGGAFLPISILLMTWLTLHGFKNGIQIQVIAEVHEFFAQYADVQAAGDIHDHLHGEHRGAGVRGGIRARRQLGDVDAALRKESREPGDDPGLIEADHIDRI